MTPSKTVYFDYNATALIRPQVIALMLDIMNNPGNASAVHGYGRSARSCVEKAREQVGALCGVNPNQVTFNSGATEANNTVLKSFAGERILISSIEHLSVLEPAAGAEQIPVTADALRSGRLQLVGKAIKPDYFECSANPRARSATMRVAERTDAAGWRAEWSS